MTFSDSKFSKLPIIISKNLYLKLSLSAPLFSGTVLPIRGGWNVVGGLKGGMEGEERPAKQSRSLGLFDGTVENVIYLGFTDCREWDAKQLSDFFFIVPGSRTVCVRSQINTGIGMLLPQLLAWLWNNQRLSVQKPVVTYKGREVDLEEQLLDFPQKALFIIHPNNTIPEELMQHSGKLWECSMCGLAYAAKKGFKSKFCQASRVPHTYIFGESTPSCWGHILDRCDKPWACPQMHKGVVRSSEVPPSHQLTVREDQSSVSHTKMSTPIADTPGQANDTPSLLALFVDSPVSTPPSTPRLPQAELTTSSLIS